MAREELLWHEAATARLVEARKRNGRIGNRKTKTGCTTCKVRRIKCDETKPDCQNCCRTGRKCEGYPTKTSVPKHSIGSLTQMYKPHSVALRHQDRRAFEYFVSWAAPRLAGTFDKDFWCGSVLQLAQIEPVVVDCVLAISSLYEHPQFLFSFYSNPSGTPETHTSNGGQQLDSFHKAALEHYNNAIRAFNQRIAEGKVTPYLALLSCSLFLCVELIRDNVFAALKLHTMGAALIQQYDRELVSEGGSGLLTTIKLMLGRIGALAPAFGQRRLIVADIQRTAQPDKQGFPSMTDARDALFDIVLDTNAFVEDAHAWKDALISNKEDNMPSGAHTWSEPLVNGTEEEQLIGEFESRGSVGTMYGVAFRMITKTPRNAVRTGRAVRPEFSSNPSTPTGAVAKLFELSRLNSESPSLIGTPEQYDELQDLSQRQLLLLERLDEWHKFYKLTLDHKPQVTPESKSYLLMYYYSSVIWLSTRLHIAETVFDEFNTHFEKLVDHVDIYLQAKAEELPVFTFELGATPPLFLAAAKCRVPSIRRRALDLMSKAPRKECMHGSVTTSQFARRLVAIEEAGLGLPLPGLHGDSRLPFPDDTILPSEHQRIRGPEILKNVTTGKMEVKVEKYSEEDGYFRIDTAYDLM